MGPIEPVQQLAEEYSSWNPPRDSRVAAITNFTWDLILLLIFTQALARYALVEIPH
jgi:hypothetical protein